MTFENNEIASHWNSIVAFMTQLYSISGSDQHGPKGIGTRVTFQTIRQQTTKVVVKVVA